VTLIQTLPLIAAVAAVLTTSGIAFQSSDVRPKATWAFPAILCALFTAWSLYTAMMEGPTGFWPEHNRNLWGYQIWFDLLLAIGIGWTLIVPRAREQGMRLFPWLALILLTGCIGVSAMFARLLFLEGRSRAVAG
jgi:hypothetical protein